MKTNIEHKILAGFGLAGALTLCLLWLGLRASARHHDRSRWVSHTLEIESQVERVRFQAANISRQKFLFLLTGAESHLVARQQAIQETERQIQELERLAADNPTQQNHIAALRGLFAVRARESEASLALRRKRRAAEASATVLTDGGQEATRQINAMLDQMRREEDRLLTERRGDSDREARQADAIMLLFSAAIAGLLGALFFEVRGSSRRQRNAHGQVASVLESIQDGFFAVDRRWNFTYINGEALRMWGMEGAELVGKNLWEIHPSARGTEFERQNTRALNEQIIVEYEEYYPAHGIWYAVRVYPSPEGLSLYFQDVTARCAAGEALERSERRLTAAQSLARIGNWELNMATGASHFSQEIYRIYHIEPGEEVTLEKALQVVHPDDREKMRQTVTNAKENGYAYEMNYRVVHPNCETLYLESRCQPVIDNGVITLVGTVQDITERKRAEERFEVLFEYSSDAHLLFDDTGIIDCNHAAVAMLRCRDKTEALALHPAVLSPTYQPDGRLSLEKCVEMDALAYEKGYHRFEWTHRKMDGETFPVEVTLTPVTLNGKPTLLVVWHDMTERKRAEEALRQSHAKLAALIAGLPDILFRMNREGVCVDYIAEEKEHARYQASDCVGKHLTEVLPPELAQIMRNGIEKAFETRTAQLAEYTMTVAGETRFREARFVAQSEEEVLIIVRDITDRRFAEQRLEGERRQNQLLLESIGEGVYGIDLEGVATFVNPAAAALLGYAVDEMLGRDMRQLLRHTRADGSPYPVAECPISHAMRAGAIFRCSDEFFWRNDGTSFAVEYAAMPILIDSMVVGMVVSFQNITERRQMETQIERQLLQMNEYSAELEFQKSELQAANLRLERLATTDGLTGLNNHRHFQTRFAETFQLASRYGKPLSILLLDVDKFKQFNDTFGHPAGDQTLKTVANALTLAARTTDFVARYGGEEFAIFLPETDAQGAIEAAERFRAAVEAQEWPLRPVTVSIGVATWNLATEMPAALIQQADEALYASKRDGRNRATHFARRPDSSPFATI